MGIAWIPAVFRLAAFALILVAAADARSQEVSQERAVDPAEVGDAAADSSAVVGRLLTDVQSRAGKTEDVQEFQGRAAEVALLLSTLADAADRQEAPEATREQYHRLVGLIEHLRQVAAAGQLTLDRGDVEDLFSRLETLEKYYYPAPATSAPAPAE